MPLLRKELFSATRFLRRFRRVVSAILTQYRKRSVVVRQLRADDLQKAFEPREMALGSEWLARQERDDMYIAVAEVDGALVGRNCLEFIPVDNRTVGYLFAAAVLRDWQSRGIGSRLVAHLERVAISRGIRSIRSVTTKRNARSLSWLEHQGYDRVGEGLVRWKEADGRYVEVDCWKLERSLRTTLWHRIRAWLGRSVPT